MTVKTVGQPLQGEGSSLGESSASEVYVVSSANQGPFYIQKSVLWVAPRSKNWTD